MQMATMLCLCLFVCGAAVARDDAAPYRIVTFGDSTTAPRNVGAALSGRPRDRLSSKGLNDARNTVTRVNHKDKSLYVYTDRLRDELPNHLKKRMITVDNEGIGKNNTAHAVARLDKDVRSKKPDLVVIQYGINDSAHDKGPGTPSRVPLDRAEQYGRNRKAGGRDDHPNAAQGNFKDNLTEIVKTLQKDQCKVILMTPNRITDYKAVTEARLAKYAQVTRDVAEALDVPLVDVWERYTEFMEDKGKKAKTKLLLDVAHPNGEGHDLVARMLIPAIEKAATRSSARSRRRKTKR